MEKEILNTEVLEEVQNIVEERFSEMIEKFFHHCEENHQKLNEALDSGNVAEIQFVAHSCKTSAGMLGLCRYSEHARSCEVYAKELLEKDRKMDDALISSVRTLCLCITEAEQVLRAYLEKS